MRKLFRVLLLGVGLLIVMNFFPNSLSATIDDRFDLNKEANVPTWYSTILLFSVSLGSLSAYVLTRKDGRDQPWPWFWLFFSITYCYLSLDEAARLHEIIDETTPVKWVFVYAPFAGAFFLLCAYYFAVVRRDDKSLRNWILGGLVLYATGGLFSETINHVFAPLSPLMWRLELVTEEGLEMIGTVIVLMGCLQESLRLFGTVYGDLDDCRVGERIGAR